MSLNSVEGLRPGPRGGREPKSAKGRPRAMRPRPPDLAKSPPPASEYFFADMQPLGVAPGPDGVPPWPASDSRGLTKPGVGPPGLYAAHLSRPARGGPPDVRGSDRDLPRRAPRRLRFVFRGPSRLMPKRGRRPSTRRPGRPRPSVLPTFRSAPGSSGPVGSSLL